MFCPRRQRVPHLADQELPILASTLLVATLYLLANVMVDVVYVAIDPRIRYA